jgi:hypothetical protein
MRKLLLGSCMFALLNMCICQPVWATVASQQTKSAGISADANKKASELPKSSSGADPVSHTAKGADYSEGAGDNAAMADMALSVAPMAINLVVKLINHLKQTAATQATSQAASLTNLMPLHLDVSFFSFYVAMNWISNAITLGHAAVNKFMRDATNITASFTGAEGFVTDKWVGPHPRNTTVAIMGDVSVTSQKFDALAFDASEYKDLENADKASARQLMDYRSEQLIQDQRSLSNVADAQWGLLYRAQQRSIKGLAGALELKSQLAKLGEIESKISADYKNKPSALNSVASRRALHDALLLLKMNVMAARTKLRAETLELDFRPMTKVPDVVEEHVSTGALLTPTGLQ